ncbi:MAG: DUF308 domain-containing protein [Clostridia bacterium]|nr:DUF308 domain-containing protein [Clostridia bacterium]
MTKLQRIKNIFSGLFSLAFSLLILWDHEDGFELIMLVLGFSMLIRSINSLVYYFTMARHMVGGKYSLYLGIIMFDFGVFTLAMSDIPRIYIVFYLMACHAFSGVIDIMRGLEAKSYETPWKLNTTHGIVSILTAIICCIFIKSKLILVYIYAAGLIYSSFTRIISSFRRSAIVYIP